MLVTRDLIGGRLFTVLYLQIIFLLKSSARDPFSFDPDPGYSVKGDGGDGTFDVGGGVIFEPYPKFRNFENKIKLNFNDL